jgi:HK97 family phage major capsid protein
MNELLKRLAEIDQRETEILGDSNKLLSDDERNEFDKLEGERSEVAKKIDAAKRDEENRKALASRKPVTVGKPAASASSPVINVKGEASAEDPKRGFSTPREFMYAVMQAKGRMIDNRLAPLRVAAAGSDEQGAYSDAHGGFLIPPAYLPGLKSVQAEGDPTAGRTQRVPMAGPRVVVNARTDKNHQSSVSGGLRVYRRAETDSASSSRMAIEQVELNAHSLMGVAYATEEILTDSPQSFAALLEAGFRDEFGAKILQEKLFGTGVGEYEGVLNAPCTVSVTKETGQSADTILYANIVKMRARLWRYANAIWLYNHDALPQLMNLADDFGRFIWQPSARDGEPDLLLGRPAIATEYADTVGDQGDIILGNWAEYLEGEIGGISGAESMHVRFLEHERAFKFFTRNDGRCWWRSALTTRNSSSTLSPFVVLDARS